MFGNIPAYWRWIWESSRSRKSLKKLPFFYISNTAHKYADLAFKNCNLWHKKNTQKRHFLKQQCQKTTEKTLKRPEATTKENDRFRTVRNLTSNRGPSLVFHVFHFCRQMFGRPWSFCKTADWGSQCDKQSPRNRQFLMCKPENMSLWGQKKSGGAGAQNCGFNASGNSP